METVVIENRGEGERRKRKSMSSISLYFRIVLDHKSELIEDLNCYFASIVS